MDGNTGRSEGATAEKAVPFRCAVLDPNRSFVDLRVGEPRRGASPSTERSGARRRVVAFPRPFQSKKSAGGGTLMAIHSKHLDTLEVVIANALSIAKNRPLADLYVRRDYTGDFRIRVQLESGKRYVITIREEQ
jgi:hypothetical protein